MKKKGLLKSIIVMVLAFIMAFAPTAEYVGGVLAQASTTTTIRFHYSRSDGVYTDWSIWGWPANSAGSDVQFSSDDDYGKVATVSVSSTVTSYGYIVRKPDWTKDYSEDRFVNLSGASGKYVDVYITSGVSKTTTYISDSGVAPCEVISATITGKNSIEANMTSVNPSCLEQMVVKDLSDGSKECEIDFLGFSNGSKLEITFAEDLNIGHKYKVYRMTSSTVSSSEADAVIDYNSDFFTDTFTYDGDDLGSTYTADATTFKVWAPTADSVELLLFSSGQVTTVDKGTVAMSGGTADTKGVWSCTVNEDLKNVYYLYRVKVSGQTNLAMDPYAKTGDTSNDSPSAGNYYAGQRGMVVDLQSTNPTGWNEDTNVLANNATDAVIYETSIRDFSSDTDSGITSAHRMKFLAFTEKGTHNFKGSTTGIDYIKNLGITHIQLMPSYDFYGTNEKTMASYNWGYNPVNYNIPEGAFSTNPTDGNVRVNEYKQMVEAIHSEDMGVIMDVVYNHVNNANTFSFERIVPGYFFRGSNGSGCGNDVASERAMVSKFIVDSVTYWATEYHLDGFRFDLVGLLDVDTMNAIRASLNEIDPEILIYGEGWSLGTSVTRDVALATQGNTKDMPGVGMFNDVIRNLVGGNNDPSRGYATGNYNIGSSDLKNITDAIAASTWYTKNPLQNINYLSCHDNYTLWDKINKANSSATTANKIKMNNLAAAMNISSQGVPLFLSGEEFLRTKGGEHNSYISSDAVNLMDWSRIDDYASVVDYYTGLIKFRSTHAGLRMTSAEDIAANMHYLTTGSNVIAYTIDGDANGEISDSVLVAFNPYSTSKSLSLPTGTWKICLNGEEAGIEPIAKASGTINLAPYSAYMMVQGETGVGEKTELFDAEYQIAYTPVKYTGKAIKPEITGVNVGGTNLVLGQDYTITYSNNVNAGTATYTIKGINNYTGRITGTYKILKANNNLKISCSNVTYGSTVAPKVTANTSKGTVTYNYKKANASDSTYTSKKPVDAGKYVVKAILAATSNYNAAYTTASFTISAKSLLGAKISGIASKKTYTGKTLKQSLLVVKVGSKTLVNGKDYVVTYSNNKNIGTAKLTIKGKGNYAGTISKSFKIVLGKTSIKSVKAGSKRATVTWKKVTGATGYKVYMATKSNGRYKLVSTVKGNSKVTYTKKKLTKNKKYYFKVVAYKKVGSKTVIGSYSSARSVKVK